MQTEQQIDSREQDVVKLISGVLHTPAKFFDNPNGAYESTCPFCYARVKSGDEQTQPMSKIRHSQDCIYLIAKDLSTNLQTS